MLKYLLYLLAILYALSPYDLIPDFLIGVGWIDDLIVLGLLWYHFIYRKRRYNYQQRYQRYRRSTQENQETFREGGSFEKEGDFEGKTRDRNPYEVLGVTKTASIEEIRAAYRQLANQYHPDKVAHLGEEFKVLAEKRFKEIQKAYQELKPLGS